MNFKGWIKTSLIEYPGKVSTVLFTGKCNFRCPFCYNTELVLESHKLPDISEKEVLQFLEKNKNLYQAVMVSGGEPTINNGLPEFIRKVKSLGLLAGLETNGTNPEMLAGLIKEKLVNYVGMDIKTPLVWEDFSDVTKVNDIEIFENVKKSIKLLMESGLDYEFRTTIVPGIHSESDILNISRSIKGANRYVIQQFIPKNTIDENLKKFTPYTFQTLDRIKKEVAKNVKSCEIRNVD